MMNMLTEFREDMAEQGPVLWLVLLIMSPFMVLGTWTAGVLFFLLLQAVGQAGVRCLLMFAGRALEVL